MSRDRKDPSNETWQDVLRSTSAPETLLHLSAQAMALTGILVQKGVCTEEDYDREFQAAKQLLEEANRENRERYLKAVHRWSIDHQIKLAEMALQLLRPLDPDTDVKVLFQPGFPPDPTSVCIRVISDSFSGLTDDQRYEMLKPLSDYFASLADSPAITRFGAVAVTRDELASSATSAEFEALYQEQRQRQQKLAQRSADG
jgi:hypothetical protein